ncbi:MAG: hypothetical protein KAZ30_03795 [Candidatus Magasanikbacteria bacterium]|nr:hypothetical protein [Candidatus Magasanikbacteria bacterium]
MINCLVSSKVSLTDDMRYTLYRNAFEMYRDKIAERKVRTPGFRATLKTDGKHGVMGTIAGVVFSAKVDTDRGEGLVTFIVRGRDLCAPEDGVWIPLPRDFAPPTSYDVQ